MVLPSDVNTAIGQLQLLKPVGNYPFHSDVFIGLLQKMANASPTDVSTAISQLSSLKVNGVFPEEVIVGLLGKLVDTIGGNNANLNLGTNKITIGTTAPSSPVNGDIWYETVDNNGTFTPETANGDGQLKWGFPWYYNFDLGSWESPRRTVNWSVQNLGAGSNPGFFLPLPEAFGLRFKPLRSNIRAFVLTTNNGSNYWSFQQSLQTKAGSQTILTTPNTSALSAGNWHELKAIFSNTVSYDLSNQATQNAIFRIDINNTGTPGTLFSGMSLDYNWVRP